MVCRKFHENWRGHSYSVYWHLPRNLLKSLGCRILVDTFFSKRMISSEVFLYVYSSLHVFDQNSASNKKCRFHSTDHFLICAELFYKLCKKRCKRKIKTLISIRRKCHQVDFRPCSNKIKPAFVTFRLQGYKREENIS